jgi:TolB-like protein/tetratricopeptide (TPR) repeat protein
MTEDTANQTTVGHDVFVSYASHDAAVANSIVENLEQHGCKCWIAPRDVAPGSQYADEIVGAINGSKVFVLVLSEHAVSSPHVGRELERAASKRRRIIVLRTDAAPLTRSFEYFLSESQWIDVAALGVPASLTKLSQAVRQRLEPSSWVSPGLGTDVRNPADRKHKPSYLTIKRLVAAAVFVVAAAVVVGVMVRYWPSKQGGPQAPMVAAISDKSIAVLPFVDMSEKKDQEYFGDGMAEEILNLLVRIPGLKVIGRTSSFQFKGKPDDLRNIGSTLGVVYVVEGSVRRSADHIRVTAQLIDARDGAHRWSETYDRSVSDVLVVQSEIATGLVRALQLEVNASAHFEQQALRNGEAYDSYLRGLHAWNRFNESGFEEAAVDFRHALDVDPSFALAAEELARTRLMQAIWGFVPPQTGYDQARAAAEATLQLNPNSALAHAVLGSVHTAYDFDWPAAEREINIAMALAPTNPHVLIFAADECLAVGRWNEAVRLMDAASAADPLHPGIYEDSGAAYLRLGRLTEAEKAARRVLEITPTYAGGHYQLAVILLTEGKNEAALAELQKETVPAATLGGLALVYHAMHRPRDADAALARFEGEHAKDFPMGVAEAYAVRGQNDQAFKWLDTAFALKDTNLWLFKGDPLLKNLEGDPRYQTFLKKMKLP